MAQNYNQDVNQSRTNSEQNTQTENLKLVPSDYKKLLSIQNQQDSEIENVKALLNKLESFVKNEGVTISTSQLRNIFSKIKKEKSVVALQLLRPKLAYVSARQPKSKDFIAVIDKVLQQVSTADEVKGFHYFFEAIIAYHKFHCGEKKQ